MKKSKMERVERTYCDNCGADITNSNRETVGGMDFCLKPFGDTRLYCSEVYDIMTKAEAVRNDT